MTERTEQIQGKTTEEIKRKLDDFANKNFWSQAVALHMILEQFFKKGGKL